MQSKCDNCKMENSKFLVDIPPFYCCYLLRSSRMHRSFYVGSTPNPVRRLRQHNGDLSNGGAYRTKKNEKRPWEMICIVSGFPSKIAALQFEYAWQHPFATRHISKSRLLCVFNKTKGLGKRGRGGVRTLDHHINVIHLLLSSPSFSNFSLTFNIFDQAVKKSWEKHNKKSKTGNNPFDQILIPSQTKIEFNIAEGLNSDIPYKEKILLDNNSSTSDNPSELELKLDKSKHPPFSLTSLKALDTSNNALSSIFDFTEAKLFSAKNNELKCLLCTCLIDKNDVNNPIAICYHKDCTSFFHLRCLALNFLNNKSNSGTNLLNRLIPIDGSCPSCNGYLSWDTLIRDINKRSKLTYVSDSNNDSFKLCSESSEDELFTNDQTPINLTPISAIKSTKSTSSNIQKHNHIVIDSDDDSFISP